MKLLSLFVISFCLLLNAFGQSNFVKVKGNGFEIAGKPYYFVGFNMYYAAYLGATEEGQKRLIKELDLLKEKGITNLRILGASESSIHKGALPSAIQTNPGVYNENLLKGLDFALFEMGKRNIYAVIYLNNFWDWSGGMQQYVDWANNTTISNPNAEINWTDFMLHSASFYTNKKAQKISRDYMSMLINRKNTYSNIVYKNDPTIMSWQLSNEPRPGPDDNKDYALKINLLANWVDSTAGFIHSLDPNHLVSTGSEGKMGSVQSTEGYLQVHSSKNIDFANFHLWAKNWGWYDAKNHSGTYDTTEIKAVDYINLHIALARKLGKPITMEEFGLDRDSCKLAPGTSVMARDMYFEKLFNVITDSIKSGAPIAGLNIWALGGYGTPVAVEKVFESPKYYMGDPLGEPQGINSVYASDTSTFAIIKKYADMLNKLSVSTETKQK